MLNDPLANVLSKVLNYELIGKKEVLIHPFSKLAGGVLRLFKDKGYVGDVDLITEARGGVGKLHLLGAINKCGVIKPRFNVGLADFEKFEKRYLPAVGVGILIVSTNEGLMTHYDAKKKKIGGRLIAYCY
ncbi:MAG TPA: 30S ribosomal protein S8 [Candidatus Woesearchaeota archaeon]|nr:MAG: 30S ribosomal protein S8 [Candidatus Woesearchaeota archaeon]HDD70828.1 30S ribosomal protein S8 [Candidatus Woesearchaeota archaeon]